MLIYAVYTLNANRRCADKSPKINQSLESVRRARGEVVVVLCAWLGMGRVLEERFFFLFGMHIDWVMLRGDYARHFNARVIRGKEFCRCLSCINNLFREIELFLVRERWFGRLNEINGFRRSR